MWEKCIKNLRDEVVEHRVGFMEVLTLKSELSSAAKILWICRTEMDPFAILLVRASIPFHVSVEI